MSRHRRPIRHRLVVPPAGEHPPPPCHRLVVAPTSEHHVRPSADSLSRQRAGTVVRPATDAIVALTTNQAAALTTQQVKSLSTTQVAAITAYCGHSGCCGSRKRGSSALKNTVSSGLLIASRKAGRKPLHSLLLGVALAKARGEQVVMTNGCFDILHAGHVAYLNEARKLGARLIVAVNSDDSVRQLKGNGRPVNPLERRMAVLAGLQAVDWVVPFGEETPARLIGRVLPDLLVKGGDYQPDQIAGADAVWANGGQVQVLKFLDGCSTTEIINAIRR